MVREVKGIEKMSMLGAGRGARERGGRRLEVEVNSKRRSPSHYVSDLVLETVEESCAFGEDIVLVGLRELTRQSEEVLALAVSVVEQTDPAIISFLVSAGVFNVFFSRIGGCV